MHKIVQRFFLLPILFFHLIARKKGTLPPGSILLTRIPRRRGLKKPRRGMGILISQGKEQIELTFGSSMGVELKD